MGIVILTFANALARDLVEDRRTRSVRSFPPEIRRIVRMKLQRIHAAKDLRDLMSPPGHRLKKMEGERRDFYSIRINDQWRIVFRFEEGNAHTVSVEDYHQ
jgi:proteic killer suppression protein